MFVGQLIRNTVLQPRHLIRVSGVLQKAWSNRNMHIMNPRETGKFITDESEDIHINDHKVEEVATVLAKEFLAKNFTLSGWKAHALHPQEANDKAIEVIFVNDILNFSFWPDQPGKKFGVQYNGKIHTGYWSMVAAFKRAEEAGKPVYDARYMCDVKEDEFNSIFASDTGVEVPLLKERWDAYTDSGKVLLEKFDGKFINCVRSCNKDAIALRNLIVENFASFRDESVYKNHKVSFYKRAQILVADIWCCFEGKGLGEFHNIEQITMFADYRVPQALEYFGVLEYSDKLKNILHRRELLQPGDRIELEIRATSIEATERLVAAVKTVVTETQKCDDAQLATVNAITVDNFLWDYSRAHRDKTEAIPFHLVRTIYY